MEKEQKTAQDPNDQSVKLSNPTGNDSVGGQATKTPSQTDQQEGNMNNGELGGNFTSNKENK